VNFDLDDSENVGTIIWHLPQLSQICI